MLSSEFPTAQEAHDYEKTESGWTCSRCGHTVKINRGGTCAGVPIYHGWSDVPDTLATKTTLHRDHKKKPAPGQKPAGAKKKLDRKGRFSGHYYPLYAIADAEDKAPLTEAQQRTLDKARYMAERVDITCVKCGRVTDTVTRKEAQERANDDALCFICDDRIKARQWARDLIERANFLILDTETTDINGEIIEIGIIDASGNVLLDQRIKPLEAVSKGAQRIHGISTDDLQDSPLFSDVYEDIKSIIQGRLVIIYNADFDTERLADDCDRHDLEQFKYDSDCAMIWYSQWWGEWSQYHQSYKWQPLNGGHSAIGDCRKTLALLHKMKEGE